MFGKLFRGAKFWQAGANSAPLVVRLADARAIGVTCQIPLEMDSLHHQVAGYAWRVFLTDYLLQNVWKQQMSKNDCLQFIDGLLDQFDPLEKKLLAELSTSSADLKRQYPGGYPADAYLRCMGLWFLRAVESPDRKDLADRIGEVLLENARLAALEI